MENSPENIEPQQEESPNPNKTREDEILGDSKALLTVLKLSVGPFFSQVTNSLYGFVNTIWISSAVGGLAVTALSSSTTIDSFSINCGFYLSTCALSKIASLFGEHRGECGAQILVDLMRFSLVFAVLLPAILIPVATPLMKWFGASDEVVSLGIDYLIPLLCCSLITCIYLLLCGCLQAEGRTVFFAIVQISSMVLNAGVFNPLFLLGFKTGIRGASLSLVCSQLVPGVVLFVLYFKGKFTVKPTFRMFINKFSPETWGTLRIGLPSLVSAASCTIPSILFTKFIGASCGTEDEFNTMMSMYNAYNRTYQIMVALFMAVTSGFLPAASFAFSAKKYRRVQFLLLHTTWLVLLISFIFLIGMYTLSGPISSIFSSDAFFKERFRKFVKPYWSTTPLAAVQYIATPLMQSTDHPIWAFIGSFATLLMMWPLTSVFFYFTNKHDVYRLFFAVLSNDVLSFFFLVPFTVLSIKQIVCPPEEAEEDAAAVEEDEEQRQIHELSEL